MAGRTNMKDKKLEEAVDYVCSCCPYIFSGSAEWDKSNPAFADWRDSATKYCDRCMVRKMTDFYNALDEHEFSEEYLSRINIKVYEGDENGNLVFEGGAAECLAWADGCCGLW